MPATGRGLPIRKWLDEGLCTACRSCEIACAFHHTSAFAPSESSLRILRDMNTCEVTIELYRSCDGCLEETGGPLCIEFCARDVLRPELLRLVSDAENGH